MPATTGVRTITRRVAPRTLSRPDHNRRDVILGHANQATNALAVKNRPREVTTSLAQRRRVSLGPPSATWGEHPGVTGTARRSASGRRTQTTSRRASSGVRQPASEPVDSASSDATSLVIAQRRRMSRALIWLRGRHSEPSRFEPEAVLCVLGQEDEARRNLGDLGSGQLNAAAQSLD